MPSNRGWRLVTVTCVVAIITTTTTTSAALLPPLVKLGESLLLFGEEGVEVPLYHIHTPDRELPLHPVTLPETEVSVDHLQHPDDVTRPEAQLIVYLRGQVHVRAHYRYGAPWW